MSEIHSDAKDLRVDLTQAAWRKSTRSGPYSDNCVEVAEVQVEVGTQAHPHWRTSSRSQLGQDCVQVAAMVDAVAVRDSKHPDGPVLLFTQGEWDAFIGGAKDGEFDL